MTQRTQRHFLQSVIKARGAVAILQADLKYKPYVAPDDYKLMEDVGSLLIAIGIFLLEHRHGE